MTDRTLLQQALHGLEYYAALHPGAVTGDGLALIYKIRARLAEPEPMSDIDYADDDALRFVQRVLESDATDGDRLKAREMVTAIRTRVRGARLAEPAVTLPPLPEPLMALSPAVRAAWQRQIRDYAIAALRAAGVEVAK